MRSSMRRVAAISAGPRSTRPRGRRAFSLSGLRSDMDAALRVAVGGGSSLHPTRQAEAARRAGPPRQLRRPAMARAQALAKTPAVPNDLAAYWLPFTPNRAFQQAPRLLSRAKDMHYFTADGCAVLDGSAGLWCCNAAHPRAPSVGAISRQAAELDYSPAFQFAHPK